MPAAEKTEQPKNHVRVGLRKSKFLYIDLTKYLLHEGETHVDLSGLGLAITTVVEIAEVLKAQGMVVVDKIETSRGAENRNTLDRIFIRVSKAATFDQVFAEQQAMRKSRKEE